MRVGFALRFMVLKISIWPMTIKLLSVLLELYGPKTSHRRRDESAFLCSWIGTLFLCVQSDNPPIARMTKPPTITVLTMLISAATTSAVPTSPDTGNWQCIQVWERLDGWGVLPWRRAGCSGANHAIEASKLVSGAGNSEPCAPDATVQRLHRIALCSHLTSTPAPSLRSPLFLRSLLR